MRVLEPTFPRVALFYWTLLWRAMLFALVVSLVLGLAFGFIAGLAGVPANIIELVGSVIGMVVGLLAWFFMLMDRMGKKCGNFRVVMVDASEPVDPSPSEPLRPGHDG